MNAAEQLARDGYVVVPGVLTPDEVARLRAAIESVKSDSEGQYRGVIVDIFNLVPQTAFVRRHPKVVETANQLLGEDHVPLAEVVAHRDGFVGWHRDTTSQERAGVLIHRSPDYLMCQFALYLQDNVPELGGGLDVVPGSHVLDDVPIEQKAEPAERPSAWDRLPPIVERTVRATHLRGAVARLTRGRPTSPDRADAVTVPSKAGDLVVFDFRLLHRATQRRRSRPGDVRKLAVFAGYARRNSHVEAYYDFLRTRPDYAWLDRAIPAQGGQSRADVEAP